MIRRTLIFAGLLLFTSSLVTINKVNKKANAKDSLTLPDGFSGSIVATGLGRTRHLIVTAQNDIYVRLARPVKGKGTLFLQQKNGLAEVVYGFGSFGGTGIYLYEGYLYTSSNSSIFRYKVDTNNRVIDTANPERIVTGLVDMGTHETKSITFDDIGNMYVPVGAPSNSCQEKDRQPGSPGVPGCPQLETAGGVWMFNKDQKDQTYAQGVKYATGLRNVVALDWNRKANKLFVMQHGRDQLNTIAPGFFSVKENAEQPAECMYALTKGDHAGWPFIYYDPVKNKKMMAPEYGGDGKKEAGPGYINPAAAYPAHLAPNGLLFYTGTQFPERYRNGAFIAFHGSWNRAPEPQAGYFVVFQPFVNGMPAGNWEVFADNFSGGYEKTISGRADHRPCGLAQGPDGSLYVSDDAGGTIFKITYTGDKQQYKTKPGIEHKLAASKPETSKKIAPPVTTKKTTTAKAPTPVKTINVAGKTVYMQYCVACHQVDGRGVGNLNPTLPRTSYVLGDKARLIKVVLEGLSQKAVDGEKYSNVMPSLSNLTNQQIADVLTYVRSSFGNKVSAVTAAEVKKVRTN